MCMVCVGVCIISAGNSEQCAAPQVTSRDYINIVPGRSVLACMH